MSNEFYDDLSTSLNQALAIAKGEAEPSRKFSHEMPDIKLIRNKTGLSQQQFADKLNISPRTLQNWEQGTRNPTGAAVTLMRLLDKQPDLIAEA
ncbi:NadS family protein [Psychrobacter sp. FBL11]|uniref:NadS family protein n=1 Tax=Psychrobacter saeujeotis TaxID=3143436 RepID=A0ABU9XB78_9GAMM|nr:NadS family protein [uncultured Psychrobacter sp.]